MLFAEDTKLLQDLDDERKFSDPVLKQFQNTCEDELRESRAYY